MKDVDNVALIVHTAERIGREVPIINIVDLIATINYAKVPCCAVVTRLSAIIVAFLDTLFVTRTGAVRKEDISVGGTACGSASNVLKLTVRNRNLDCKMSLAVCAYSPPRVFLQP